MTQYPVYEDVVEELEVALRLSKKEPKKIEFECGDCEENVRSKKITT